jgi:hypothetical protein
MYRFGTLLFLGIVLNGCAPETHTDVYVSEPHRTVLEQPVVTFNPRKDVMTETGVAVRGVSPYTSRSSVEMSAPSVNLGAGDYHQNRYSPSIFKDGRR